MSKKHFHVLKSGGYLESFSKRKLLLSLKRAGLPQYQCQKITDKICKEVTEGANTKSIYRKALRLVNQSSSLAAINYSLKKAIYELGPTGYHFEVFVSRYFEERGYKTKISQTLQGRLVTHEVDVVATLKGKNTFIECKFHNHSGRKNDVKVTLYVKARRDDLKEGPEGKKLKDFYIASNTTFTQDAIQYATGSKIHLLGLNAPVEKPFIEEIKKLKLYPITSLKSLNHHIKHELLKQNIILARDLLGQEELLGQFGFPEEEIIKILDEVEVLTWGIE